VKPGKELLFCALGGSGEIGMNVNLYGADGKWLMVDLGMTFGANEYPGTELVFADLEFIEERKKDLVGVVLTHAHEDHIGAVPYFAQELGVPLYATPFTARLVADKLQEAGLLKEVQLKVIDHLEPFQLGPFSMRYLPLAHSIAEGNALVIETPYGRVFHTGDWKLDDDPLVGVPATAAELTAIGDQGAQLIGVGRRGTGGLAGRGWPASRQACAGHDLRLQRGATADAGRSGRGDQAPALRGGALA